MNVLASLFLFYNTRLQFPYSTPCAVASCGPSCPSWVVLTGEALNYGDPDHGDPHHLAEKGNLWNNSYK